MYVRGTEKYNLGRDPEQSSKLSINNIVYFVKFITYVREEEK